MADIRPFRAFRPPPELAPRVASPPYDVVDTAQARALTDRNPDSFLRVSRPEVDLPVGIDEHADDVYAQGAKNLAELVARKALVQDSTPTLYVYSQRMGDHHQTGVVACASVQEYVDGLIRKHEKTRPDKETDRTRHIDELGAHDEPVFLTYRAVRAIDNVVAQVTATEPEYDFVTDDGVAHKFWCAQEAQRDKLVRLFGEEVPTLYVADGHHRSAAAARVHDKWRGDGREHDVFLTVIFPDDQMNILPYNRVVKDRQGRDAEALYAALSRVMDLEESDKAAPDWPGTFGLYLGGKWYRGTTRPESFDADDAVALLDCAICQNQILSPIFGITDPRRDTTIGFVGGIHGSAELERRVDSGEADVAIYLFPTKMEQVMAVSDAGRVMPPKSTWFEPKLRSGLFVHTF